tara:strand:+ start:1273 stop:2544 length:1272 start_codon:yes stop_codon:yes gene_type:complete
MSDCEYFGKIFRKVPDTGVIYVMNEAKNSGYSEFDREWVNLGQGQPEVGVIRGAPGRISSIGLKRFDLEYAPVSGLNDLKLSVAEYYNYFYRKGRKSRYTEENVSIAPGGRTALTRIITTLSDISVGHILPDYTAYEELLGSFGKIKTIPIPLSADTGYSIEAKRLESEILSKDISAILLSNPCNPTGRAIFGDELNAWCEVSLRTKCFMIFDEFYGHYVWNDVVKNTSPGISAAEFISDVNKDPIIIVDGVTKNWRYPGARISWTLGPKDVIRAINSAGSFIDGGASRPMQVAAIKMLNKKNSLLEANAIRELFGRKRRLVIDRLRGMGVSVAVEPEGTFYVWCNVGGLSENLNTGMKFFRMALKNKVICVPGQFFDIDPGGRRVRPSDRYSRNIRISFGPRIADLKRGMSKLERMIAEEQK